MRHYTLPNDAASEVAGEEVEQHFLIVSGPVVVVVMDEEVPLTFDTMLEVVDHNSDVADGAALASETVDGELALGHTNLVVGRSRRDRSHKQEGSTASAAEVEMGKMRE